MYVVFCLSLCECMKTFYFVLALAVCIVQNCVGRGTVGVVLSRQPVKDAASSLLGGNQ